MLTRRVSKCSVPREEVRDVQVLDRSSRSGSARSARTAGTGRAAPGGVVDDVGAARADRCGVERGVSRASPEDLGREQVRAAAEVAVRRRLRASRRARVIRPSRQLDRVVLADELEVVRLGDGADGGVAVGRVAQRPRGSSRGRARRRAASANGSRTCGSMTRSARAEPGIDVGVLDVLDPHTPNADPSPK